MAARGEDLRQIGDFEALCRYLEDTLGWPLGEYDFDALTFQYEPEELGLLDQYADAIESIHQLRPVVDGQPWGIFFVRFRKKKLPVGVLRRILSQLVLKKRASANQAERAAWRADDLLFVSAFGEEAGRNREIAFAHFHRHGSDLPTLRVIGWDGNDTPLKLEYLQGVVADKLRWPSEPTDADAWRKLWRSPFRHRPGHVIRKSDELAQELAKLARAIRDRAQAVMKAESAKGPLTQLYDAFKKSLIHDLTPEGFADTYAQTITYGLLTAAISRTEMSEGRHGTALLASDLADMVPVTNPFLKEMLQTFLEVGGRKGGVDFDELGVQDVVELLRGEDTDLPAILRDFGNKTRGEDPVIHFYEHFLKAYNKQLKIQRGVFYTPQPVVSYIVRSVHELLQTEFGLADGLADTTTWGEMLKKHPGLKLPPLTDEPGEKRTISSDESFVQILDPATGTATFLVEVIDVIHRTLAAKWQQQRLTDAQQRAAWNDYVSRHLLPRLHAFELMMAPYAIAHMKIGLKLAETGYRFGTEERARIYLTNALEPWVKQLPLIGFEALAHEAAAVNEIKRHKRFTVVLGNPPYARHSSNPSRDSDGKMTFIGQLMESYKEGCPELRKPAQAKYLQDDYVKFIRLAEAVLRTTGSGAWGFITNHSFLDNPTFRGMRRHLKDSFSKLWFLDLHGSSKKKEVAPDGGNEENVFDIQQGVAVGLGVATAKVGDETEVSHGDLWGIRKGKYATLSSLDVGSSRWVSLPSSEPMNLFVPQNELLKLEYEQFPKLPEIFDQNGDPAPGVVTTHDEFAIAFTRAEIAEHVEKLLATRTEAEAREIFRLCTQDQWNYDAAKRELKLGLWENEVGKILYRPFDIRWTIYDRNVAVHRRERVTRHMLKLKNLSLVSARANRSPSMDHFFCSRFPSETKCGESTIQSYFFPLFLAGDGDDEHQGALGLDSGARCNIGQPFIRRVEALTRTSKDRLTPADIFHYAYAVFHSPGYRRRYAEFLKIDFPRLPLTRSLDLFRALARIGGELTALHLLESPRLAQPITEFIGSRNPEVEKVSWSRDTVWVDKAQTIGFRGVREPVWNFHIGGYQVCEKWLKDRGPKLGQPGRKLSKDDIAHYQKIIVALSETIRLMAEIDRTIDHHGGWPGAFVSSTAVEDDGAGPEPRAQALRLEAERAPK